jgi:hypothetical protein
VIREDNQAHRSKSAPPGGRWKAGRSSQQIDRCPTHRSACKSLYTRRINRWQRTSMARRPFAAALGRPGCWH